MGDSIAPVSLTFSDEIFKLKLYRGFIISFCEIFFQARIMKDFNPHHSFRIPSDKDINGNPVVIFKEDIQQKESLDDDKFLLCRQCLQIITHRSQRVVVNGSHEHTFANPHGIVFDIGCFKSAIGCGYIGVPTKEFSWFMGYMWQVAICGSCMAHVGWLFTSYNLESFTGLILNRLADSG
jgi:hypothetical protein